MAGLLPSPSLKGLIDYVVLGAGISLGFILFAGPMNGLTQSLRKK
tara:strand:- start:1287 stop:1421 length:135 start_codon:yes stop_codon:yes gene_type:complete